MLKWKKLQCQRCQQIIFCINALTTYLNLIVCKLYVLPQFGSKYMFRNFYLFIIVNFQRSNSMVLSIFNSEDNVLCLPYLMNAPYSKHVKAIA